MKPLIIIIFYFIKILFLYTKIADCKQEKQEDVLKSALDLLKKEAARLEKELSACDRTDLHYLDHLRINHLGSLAVACHIKYLSSNKDVGWIWSSLATIYLDLEESSSANICIKQAAQLTGIVSNFVRGWYFIGPFVIGKAEVDGDPVEAFGGISNVSKSRLSKKFKLFSELMPHGEVSWKKIPEKKGGDFIQIAPEINWGDFVNSLGSVGIMEWQGWIVSEFAVNENDKNIVVQCLGIHTIFVDGMPIVGDVYRRDQFKFSISLSYGIHSLFIRIRTKGPFMFRCTIEDVTQTFRLLQPTFLPDFYDGHFFSSYLSLPIANYHSSKWLKNIKVACEDQEAAFDVNIVEKKVSSLAPGQVRPLILHIQPKDDFILRPCKGYPITIKVSTSEGQLSQLLPLRCRNSGESFIFTFLDHDGSVQHGAAVRPLHPCPGNVCPVLLTLHGTTISPQNQADGYKRMVNGEFLFGLENLWIVAPTRHGAHNWEGPGALTALSALKEFSSMTLKHDWIKDKASPDYVVFAGHSMGGHGAWHLATHFPDRALAVVSLSGWIKKEEYGDSNLFFRHDIANSHVEANVKAIMEKCIAENEADKFVSNLKGIPVITRIGSQDRTIHPYFVRRMYRLLKEFDVNVTYVEVPGKEHWWWDTKETNDGGCVNDEQLWTFTNSHAVIPPATPLQPSYCDKDELDSCQTSRESSTVPETFTYTVINPAFMGPMRGIEIIEQTIPLQTSTFKVSIGQDSALLLTDNVRIFQLKSSLLRPIQWKNLHLQIDSDKYNPSVDSSPEDGLCFCRLNGSWMKCNLCNVPDVTPGRSLSARIGPARRISEDKFLIVTGTKGTKSLTRSLEVLSVYIANLFFLTSDAVAYIVRDQDLSDSVSVDYNLIVIGGEEENSFSQQFINKIPLKYEADMGLLRLDKCHFRDERMGALFLAPHGQSRLALVLMGNNLDGLIDVVSLAMPTIPPMTRSPFSNMVPDFVITGSSYRSHGPGGYLCTGFWSSSWDLRPELISCPQCAI